MHNLRLEYIHFGGKYRNVDLLEPAAITLAILLIDLVGFFRVYNLGHAYQWSRRGVAILILPLLLASCVQMQTPSKSSWFTSSTASSTLACNLLTASLAADVVEAVLFYPISIINFTFHVCNIAFLQCARYHYSANAALCESASFVALVLLEGSTWKKPIISNLRLLGVASSAAWWAKTFLKDASISCLVEITKFIWNIMQYYTYESSKESPKCSEPTHHQIIRVFTPPRVKSLRKRKTLFEKTVGVEFYDSAKTSADSGSPIDIYNV